MEKCVYIVVLNYNNYHDTVECISSLERIKYKNYKIVVIDNNSSDGSGEKLKFFCTNRCKFIQENKNLGYAGGNNIGIRYAVENNAYYICVINNDTTVHENFLSILTNYMNNNPECGIAGPVILEYDKPHIIQSSGGIIDIKRGDVSPINNGITIDDVKEKVIECGYIGGACMLIKSEVINKIGTMPESYFLFFEETEWCYKAKKAGFKVTCILESMIWHKGSISVNAISGLSEYLMNRNRIVFEKRNADLYEIIYFYIFLILQTLYQIIFRKEKTSKIRHYIHGIINKIDKKYSFIYIR